jgi:hypothetical protein
MKISDSIACRLKLQHETISEIIFDLDEQQLFKKLQPDKWNIHDNIAHLTRYQLVFIERINKILSTGNPSFGRYKAEDDPEFEGWRTRPTKDLIKQIELNRQDILQLIEGISETELNKTGTHPVYGNLNILKWIEFFLLHEAHHLLTIFQLANYK